MTKQAVVDKAIHVFGSARIAHAWLNHKVPELDGRCPRELLETVEGQVHVLKILQRWEQEQRLC